VTLATECVFEAGCASRQTHIDGEYQLFMCVLEYLVDSNFQLQLREGFFAGRGCQAVRSLPGGIQVGRLHVVGKFRVQGLPANLQAWKDGGRKAFAVD